MAVDVTVNKRRSRRRICIWSSCHFFSTTTTALLPPSLYPLFNKRALVVIAQSGTTSLLIQMSNNAAAGPNTHMQTGTHTHTGLRLTLHMEIHIIDLSSALPSSSHTPFFIFNEWLVDLAGRYKYVSIKQRQGSVLTCVWNGQTAVEAKTYNLMFARDVWWRFL